jgi:hypothetical protein
VCFVLFLCLFSIFSFCLSLFPPLLVPHVTRHSSRLTFYINWDRFV